MKEFTSESTCGDFLEGHRPSEDDCGDVEGLKLICSGATKRYCVANKCSDTKTDMIEEFSLDTYWSTSPNENTKGCIYGNNDLDDADFFVETRTRFLASHTNWPQNHYMSQVGPELTYVGAEEFFDRLLNQMLPADGDLHPLNNRLKKWTLTTDIIGDLRIIKDAHCTHAESCMIGGLTTKIYDGTTTDCFTNADAKVEWQGEIVPFADYMTKFDKCFDVPAIEIIG